MNVDKAQSEKIKSLYGKNRRGFGSIPVVVTIGETTWNTSIFPDTKAGTYLLPVKADVRRREDIYVGDTITFSFRVR